MFFSKSASRSIPDQKGRIQTILAGKPYSLDQHIPKFILSWTYFREYTSNVTGVLFIFYIYIAIIVPLIYPRQNLHEEIKSVFKGKAFPFHFQWCPSCRKSGHDSQFASSVILKKYVVLLGLIIQLANAENNRSQIPHVPVYY